MIENKLIEKIDFEIKNTWKKDLKIDYKKSYLLKEDTLKNAFYYHLRTRLGDELLNENNLRIFTEYYISGERIDLVIAEIDSETATESYLGDSIKKVLVAIEMKYKSGSVNESVFYQDINKILPFIDTWGNDTKHYFAFIQERYFKTDDIINWIGKEESSKIKGKVTELYAYWDKDSNDAIWRIFGY